MFEYNILKNKQNKYNLCVCYIILSVIVFISLLMLFIILDIFKIFNIISVSLVLLVVFSLIFIFLYKNLFRPISQIMKGLSLIDFESNTVNFTYIDRLEPSGLFGISSLGYKIKYLMDIIEERIIKYNNENYKSEHDSLSGCFNRVHLERVKTQYETQDSTYVIFIDVNNLKKMNDIYGHEAGDNLIRSASRALSFWNQYGDVYRMGGDEFMVVLSNMDFDYCTKLLKQWYPTVGILNKDTDGFKCVLSYGVATCKGFCDFDKLQKVADEAMYKMKLQIKRKFGEDMR